MSMNNETSLSTMPLLQLFKGDPRLKRVEASIFSRTYPEVKITGYALVSELNESTLTFFSTQKFKTDEMLVVHLMVETQVLEFHVRMLQMNEQISSGRIMTSIPAEGAPFPALKFYRCFARILDLKRNGKSIFETDEVAPEATETTNEVAPTLQAVPDPAPEETPVEELKVA